MLTTLLINGGACLFSWKIADLCQRGSLGWWLNIFASALSAVVVLRALGG